jgi:hypothetical protein
MGDPTAGDTSAPVTFGDALYLTLVTMTTVGYGDFSPVSDFGKLFAVLAGAFGVVISSFVVAVTASQLAVSRSELFASNWVRLYQLRVREMTLCASLIQVYFRHARAVRRRLAGAEATSYHARRIAISVALHRVRTERIDLLNSDWDGEDPNSSRLKRIEAGLNLLLGSRVKSVAAAAGPARADTPQPESVLSLTRGMRPHALRTGERARRAAAELARARRGPGAGRAPQQNREGQGVELTAHGGADDGTDGAAGGGSWTGAHLLLNSNKISTGGGNSNTNANNNNNNNSNNSTNANANTNSGGAAPPRRLPSTLNPERSPEPFYPGGGMIGGGAAAGSGTGRRSTQAAIEGVYDGFANVPRAARFAARAAAVADRRSLARRLAITLSPTGGGGCHVKTSLAVGDAGASADDRDLARVIDRLAKRALAAAGRAVGASDDSDDDFLLDA